MTLPYPNAKRVQWDTIRLSGDNVEVTLKNDTFTTFSIESMRRLLHSETLTSDDVRAIVKDEMREQGWSRMGTK